MWGDAEWCRKRDESEARERAHRAGLAQEAADVRALLRRAETDPEAARLVEMARLLGPDAWASRRNTLESVDRRRLGPLANDPREVMQIEMLQQSADLALRYCLRQAQRAIDLVRSW